MGFTELYLHRVYLLLCYQRSRSESRAGTASVSLGIIPNVLHLGWFAHDSKWLCRSLILLHLSQPCRITKKEMNMFAFFIFAFYVLHSEGTRFWKSFQWEVVPPERQSGWRSVKCCSHQLLHSPVSRAVTPSYRGNISLSGFVPVCVLVCARVDVRLRTSDETFMQSLSAAQTLHFPNEPLPWQRGRSDPGGVMATDYSLPS